MKPTAERTEGQRRMRRINEEGRRAREIDDEPNTSKRKGEAGAVGDHEEEQGRQ